MEAARPLTLSRIENLSDSVFAFAMTLFVLGLGVDEASRFLETDDARGGIVAMAPRFLTLVFGFFGLGAFWVAHNMLLAAVRTVDRNLVQLNMLVLVFAVVLPFSIDLWGRHWQNSSAILVVVSNLVLLNGALALEWRYVVGRRETGGDPIEPRRVRRAWIGFALPNVFWAIVAILAFVHPLTSVVVFVATTFSYALPITSRLVYQTRS